jgi:hypothetical protein
MDIVNRRNALLGWATWQAAKQIAKRKARAAGGSQNGKPRRLNKAALVAGLAAVGGAVAFWQWSRRNGGEDEQAEWSPSPEETPAAAPSAPEQETG